MNRIALLLLLCSASAHAEDGAVDATVVAPFGDWAKETGVGAGATARVRVPLSDFTAITARAGLVWHAAASDGALTVRRVELPLIGGVRYYVTAPARARAWLAGEAGVVLERASITQGAATDDEWRFVFGSSLGAGVELDGWELGASIWLPDLAHVDRAAAAMIAIGCVFARW